ncbi:MAG: hypothetical protein DDT38_01266 [Firmicutes bacterium]|nr:hypothetical protein [candidate division NPL-UPA2 bacterium]
MVRVGIKIWLTVETSASRHIHLAPNNRLDSFLLRRLIEFYDTMHIAVVRNGERLLPERFNVLNDFVDLSKTIEQTIF